MDGVKRRGVQLPRARIRNAVARARPPPLIMDRPTLLPAARIYGVPAACDSFFIECRFIEVSCRPGCRADRKRRGGGGADFRTRRLLDDTYEPARESFRDNRVFAAPAIRLRLTQDLHFARPFGGVAGTPRDFAVHGRAPEHKIVLRVIPGSGKEFPRKDYANAESL